ncbi:MAG TPA: hypothetical protein VFS05_00755 [Gemmatimonadaceae bacterium]|nr:hypothetical protein [Gemmatimonadaceae bacterium]
MEDGRLVPHGAPPMAPAETARAPLAVARSADDETVFTVLAGRARDTRASRLWWSVWQGAGNGAALWLAVPGHRWLALIPATVLAYGVWGLADRALAEGAAGESSGAARRLALRATRWAAVLGGSAAAVGSVLGLMGAALAGWIL